MRIITPLTALKINAAKPQEKDYTLHDGGGLYLLIKKSGSKLWRFSYYHPITKKRALVSLGSLATVSLAQARKVRDRYRVLIRQGIDPQEYERQQRIAERQRQGTTFKVVADDWLKRKKAQNLSISTDAIITRTLNLHILPRIGDIPISDLTTQHFVCLLEPLQSSGRLDTLRRTLQRINEIMNFAVNSGLINANPAANVGKAFSTPTKTHRPTIRPERLPELMQAIYATRIEPQTRLLILWQLLTATRPAEAAAAQWSEIDLKAHTWTIPAGRMKMRREHIIPLSVQAMAILEAMKPISAHRTYVFPSFKSPSGHTSRQAVNMAIKRTKFAGELVSHGLRAIFSTAANESGFNPFVIEAALAHVDTNESRRAYNRSNYLEKRRELMRWWGDVVDKAKGEGLQGIYEHQSINPE